MRVLPLVGILLFATLTVGSLDQAAAPTLCNEPCIIESHTLAYTPPITVIATGQSAQWHSLDIGHVHLDQDLAAAPCFFVSSSPGEPSPPVRFDVVDGTLVATTGGPDGTSAVCGNAMPVEAGFLLPYYCMLHPLTMHGALLVVS